MSGLSSDIWQFLHAAKRLLRDGRPEEADDAATTALRTAEAQGREAESVADVLDYLSRLDLTAAPERRSRAVEYARRALAIRRKLRSFDDPKVAESLVTLATALEHNDEPDEALSHLLAASAVFLKGRQESSFARRSVLAEICRLAVARDRNTEAEAAARELLAWTPVDDSAIAVTAYARAAITLVEIGRAADAVEPFETALRMARQIDSRKGFPKSAVTAEIEERLNKVLAMLPKKKRDPGS